MKKLLLHQLHMILAERIPSYTSFKFLTSVSCRFLGKGRNTFCLALYIFFIMRADTSDKPIPEFCLHISFDSPSIMLSPAVAYGFTKLWHKTLSKTYLLYSPLLDKSPFLQDQRRSVLKNK